MRIMNKIYALLPRILIITGALLLLTACGLVIRNIIEDRQAGQNAQEILDQIGMETEWDWVITIEAGDEDILEVSGDPTSTISEAEPAASVTDDTFPEDEQTDVNPQENDSEAGDNPSSGTDSGSSSSGSKGGYVSYEIIGIIEIPKINLKLPVIGECTNALLKISCCRIAGRATGKPRRLIVAGHNLKSHFASLVDLENGDTMTYTMPDGTAYTYAVVDMIGVHKTQVEDVQGGEGWDITLITCKKDNTYRTVVRLAEVEGQVA